MGISSRLPGISSENSRKRNVVVGVVYVFVFLMVIGAAAPSEDTESDDSSATATDAPTDKMTAATDKATKQASTSQPTEKATQTQSDGGSGSDSSGYSVKIIAEGGWSGSIMSGGSSKSVEGEGTETFKLDGNPSIVSANAQKQGANSNELTIQIIKDGKVVKESSTSAEHGLAQVSTSALDSGGNSDKKSGYKVKISYKGDWSGSLGGDGSQRSVDGSGTETFDIKGNPMVISANAQKQDTGSGTLTIQIVKDGEVVKESTTDADYGVASVSVTV